MATLHATDVPGIRGRGPSIQTAARALKAAWARERTLCLVGLVGLVLGLLALAILLVHGRFIRPNGDLARPVAFNTAVGAYVLTLALLLPLAQFSPRGQERWRRWTATLVLGSLAIENVQTYRGLDPRFHPFDAPGELLVGILFLLIGLGEIVLFTALAVRLFRRPASAQEAPLLLAARYAGAAVGLGFASGLWMSAAMGSRFGEAGNLLPLHGLGFHGLQAVPVVALLLGWAGLPPAAACRRIHIAGTAWLGACLGVGWQALQGRAVLEPSPATLAALTALLVWQLVTIHAAVAWLRGSAGQVQRDSLLASGSRAVEDIDQVVDGARLP